MTKSIENIPACNELYPLAMDLIGRLNTSEFVNGGMPPAKVSLRGQFKIVSEYDQEIPQSQTADNPVASRGRAAQPSRDTRKTN